jgi:hypothetical protein
VARAVEDATRQATTSTAVTPVKRELIAPPQPTAKPQEQPDIAERRTIYRLVSAAGTLICGMCIPGLVDIFRANEAYTTAAHYVFGVIAIATGATAIVADKKYRDL